MGSGGEQAYILYYRQFSNCDCDGECFLKRPCGEVPHVRIGVIFLLFQSRDDSLLYKFMALGSSTIRGSQDLQRFGDVEPDVWNTVAGELEQWVDDFVTNDFQIQGGGDRLDSNVSTNISHKETRHTVIAWTVVILKR